MTHITIPDLKYTVRKGQTLFVPFDGVTGVKIIDVLDKDYKVQFDNGKSLLLPKNVLFSYENREKCQRIWNCLVWIAGGIRMSEMSIEKRMDHIMLTSKAVNGSHIQHITAAIINDTFLYYQDAGKPAFMMKSTAPYEDYEMLISSLGLYKSDVKSYSMDIEKQELLKDMFPLEGGIYAEWSEFFKRNRQEAGELLREAVEIIDQQKREGY